MNKKAITWGVRLGSISLAVGLAAYMSAQEAEQQGVSVQQNSTSSQQDDTLAPQTGQTESNQQFGGGRGHRGPGTFNEQSTENEQSGTDDQSGTSSQYGENAQSEGSTQQNSRSFDTMTGGS